VSAVLALLGSQLARQDEENVARLLSTMAHRGADEIAIWRSQDALLAGARDEWEQQDEFAGRTLVASRGSLMAVADATLYYKHDLRERLAGTASDSSSDEAGHLILAAYAAFGIKCLNLLEGDFAFCIWDEKHRSLFCARDPFGIRSLFYSSSAAGLTVASTPHPFVLDFERKLQFDRLGVLRAILMRAGDGSSTGIDGVEELPPGHYLLATPDGLRVAPFWTARGSERWAALPADEAPDAFAELLSAASAERSAPSGTSLAMSGGQDSTALLASLAAGTGADSLNATNVVSLGYPAGDPGNEDWYVEHTAGHFGRKVIWVPTGDLDLFETAEARAPHRSRCDGHPFEAHNRALAAAGRRAGARVLLNGHGGDNLVAVGDWMMADLLRGLRWRELRSFFLSRNYRGFRHFRDYCLRPALPLGILDAIEPFLGRRICSRPFERPIPSWITAPRREISGIVQSDRLTYTRTITRPYSTVTAQRRAWRLLYSGFGRISSALFDMTRLEGVELRMPFYDLRLVEFVMARPGGEFNQPGQKKALLRAAMNGKLPDRRWETQSGGMKPGSVVGLVRSRWHREVSALVERLSSQRWLLEEIGAINRRALLTEVQTAARDPGSAGAEIGQAVLAEVWLRKLQSNRITSTAAPVQQPL
jgi:asparagine synthase (glutamine-hydrolysing)